jgi:hypothetical protein
MQGHEEVRLDLNPDVKPDVVGDIRDIAVKDCDGTYSAHCLEHLYPHEVCQSLRSFLAALRPGGWSIFMVPDLEDVKATDEVLYEVEAGPVTGLDLIYGMSTFISILPHMAHHCGFTASTLGDALREAGYVAVETHRLPDYNLMAVGRRAQ